MGTGPFFSVQPTVFFVESPSADDLFRGRTELKALSEALKLAEIDSRLYVALNRESLLRGLSEAAMYISSSLRHIRPHLIPIVHLSAHGNADGLALTDGDFVSWEELRSILLDFLEHAKGIGDRNDGLSLTGLCLSACKGSNARKLFDGGPPYPCIGTVGPTEDVDWSDSLTAFVTFYHQLFYKEAMVIDAVATMNRAAGITSFEANFAPDLAAHLGQYGLFVSEELEQRLLGSAQRPHDGK